MRPPVSRPVGFGRPQSSGVVNPPLANSQPIGVVNPPGANFHPIGVVNPPPENLEPIGVVNQPPANFALAPHVRTLHPSRMNGAKWFNHDTVLSTRVRKIIEGCFRGPWFSWKRVPQFYKDAWYSTFQTYFEWDAAIEQLVKTNFDQLAAYRLKGMVSLAKSRAEKPDWILSEHWRTMVEYWGTPKAMDRSEKARSSRMFSRDGLGPHRHRSGSRSYAKVKNVLEANNEDSSFIAVMKKTHQKPDGTYVDERARLIAEKYDEHVQELLSLMESSNGEVLTEPLTIEARNEIYLKVAGISKQGRIFGLGSLRSGVSMSLDGSSAFPQATGEVETLTHRVEQLGTELQKSQNENVLMQKRLEEVEKIVQRVFGQNILASTSTPTETPSASTETPSASTLP